MAYVKWYILCVPIALNLLFVIVICILFGELWHARDSVKSKNYASDDHMIWNGGNTCKGLQFQSH